MGKQAGASLRQLEGFGPVYHQILWNGRKGIIGPELPCGKYTFVLIGTDVKGNKQTLRRRVVVKCTEQELTSTACQQACADCEKSCKETAVATGELDYKAARLWKKPKRKMGGPAKQKAAAVATVNTTATTQSATDSTSTKTVTETTIVEEYDDAEWEAAAAKDAATQTTSTQTTQTATQTSGTYGSADDSLLMNNPYGEPFDNF